MNKRMVETKRYFNSPIQNGGQSKFDKHSSGNILFFYIKALNFLNK